LPAGAGLLSVRFPFRSGVVMRWPETLADYPLVVVRLGCAFCTHRRGVYRLARLAERYGARASLDRVRRDLAKPCPRLAYAGTSLKPGCRVAFVDLMDGVGRPADVPRRG